MAIEVYLRGTPYSIIYMKLVIKEFLINSTIEELKSFGFTDFEIKELKFLAKHDIDFNKNRKTGKEHPTKNFYVDENQEIQLGKLSPLIHHYTNPKTKKTADVKVCKFCNNPIPKTLEKGHDMIFCRDNDCQNLHWKIQNLLEEKKKRESDIEFIIWNSQKIKQEFWDKSGKFYPPKYKVPERITMKIVRKGKPDQKDWEPLTIRRRISKKDV